jgi:hypothetical protein
MGANDVHGARFTVSLPECYIATVNEPETITAAKPFCPGRTVIGGLMARSSSSNPGFPATVHIERS